MASKKQCTNDVHKNYCIQNINININTKYKYCAE